MRTTSRENCHRLEKAKRFGRMFGAGPIAIRAAFTRAVKPKAKTTPCIGCGRKRMTGWVLERGNFRLPMCSMCVQNLYSATVERTGDLGHFPDVARVRFYRVLWTIKVDPK